MDSTERLPRRAGSHARQPRQGSASGSLHTNKTQAQTNKPLQSQRRDFVEHGGPNSGCLRKVYRTLVQGLVAADEVGA